MDIKFNMNQYARVKLTKEGKNILCKDFLTTLKMIQERTGRIDIHERKTMNYTRDGWYEAQLWTLFRVFGEHIGMARNLMFETDIILKDVKI